VIGVGRGHELSPPQAQQVVLAHNPTDPLVVHYPSAAAQFRRNPRPAIAGELQSDPLDRVPQIQIRVWPTLCRVEPV